MRTRTTSAAGFGGRYRLDAIVAHGRVADVFSGWDRDRRRPVAVKWIRAGIDPSHYPRWRSDADELRRLDHPGLVRERDHGIEGGRPFVVMDLVAPTTLRTVCAATPLVPAAVAGIGQQLAATLRYLHDNEVVHRAVTADRILVDVAGDFRVWLDCGPWVPDESPSMPHRAPELRGGEEASVSGDLWSLGMVILDCLVGRPAGDGAHPTGVRPLGSDLTEPWQVLLPMMLDPRPEHRPTAGQVAAIVGASRARTSARQDSTAMVPPVAEPRVQRSRTAAVLVGRLGTRTTAITTVTAVAAIVLLAVGVRVVRAAEEPAAGSDATSSVRAGSVTPPPSTPTRSRATVGSVPASRVPASPVPVATPIIRTVAAVTPLAQRRTVSTGGPVSAGPAGHGRGHAYGRSKEQPKPVHPHPPTPAAGRHSHGRAVGHGGEKARAT